MKRHNSLIPIHINEDINEDFDSDYNPDLVVHHYEGIEPKSKIS